jgi:hypothetical protein
MKMTIREMIRKSAVSSPAGTGSKSTGIRKGQQPAVNQDRSGKGPGPLPLSQGAVKKVSPLEETTASDSPSGRAASTDS